MPLQATSGAASYDGFGGGPAAVPNYIEECFATHLYTGNGSTQTITNGIDLSTKGGLVWVKGRSTAGYWHVLTDSARGVGRNLFTNDTSGQSASSLPNGINAFNANGFGLGTDLYGNVNTSGDTFASWTFRKQPKFFDVVTWTGTGSTQTISHSLGSAPGCIIVKRTDSTSNWRVYHRSLSTPNENWMHLNTTDAAFGPAGSNIWNVTSTTFQADTYLGLSTSGATYVAYLFAHNAGGFGLTGTDNVISCGSFTADGSGNATVSLGWEPQFILYKRTDGISDWTILDTMRGWNQTSLTRLFPNNSNAESVSAAVRTYPTATGFEFVNGLLTYSANYIYIAIRRGPMKTPTTGTSVFQPFVNYTSIGNQVNGTMGPVDLGLQTQVPTPFSAATHFSVFDRLRGSQKLLATSVTNAEGSGNVFFDTNTGIRNESWFTNGGVGYNFRRAPGFFDVVCYTGTGSATTVTHNLGVVPEAIIIKKRNAARDWGTGWASLGWTARGPALNSTETSFTTSLWWNDTAPTSSVFTVGTSATTNQSGDTYVAYLFATVSGVSKVGSYTGSGTTKQIDCGFTGGARFVLIKRTDSTGDWYVWDSARGIVSGNDPYLLLNSTAAEVTSTDYIDTYSAGFEISSTAPAAINANGGTFIFLAIA